MLGMVAGAMPEVAARISTATLSHVLGMSTLFPHTANHGSAPHLISQLCAILLLPLAYSYIF